MGNSSRFRLSIVITAGILLSVALSGCTAESQPTAAVPSYVGQPLGKLRTAVGDNAFLIYDLSRLILNLDPEYNDGQPQFEWTVIAQCGSKGTVAVAVLPSKEVTASMKAKAKAGGYNGTLLECS